MKKTKEKYNPADVALVDIDFDRMYSAYFVPLCRFARGKVEDEEDAKDIVSHFFLRLWENRENIYIKGPLIPYLFQAVRNCCLNHLKKEKERREYGEKISGTHEDENFLLPDHDDPFTKLTTQEMEIELSKAIAALPQKNREIYKLVREKGLEYHEVAEKLGITIGTVCTQISRATTHLCKSMKISNKPKR